MEGKSSPSKPKFVRKVEKCVSCGKTVYSMERIAVDENTIYHRWCFKCVLCSTTLVLGKHKRMSDGTLYCSPHYDQEVKRNSGYTIKHLESKLVPSLLEIQDELAKTDPKIELATELRIEIKSPTVDRKSRLAGRALPIPPKKKEEDIQLLLEQERSAKQEEQRIQIEEEKRRKEEEEKIAELAKESTEEVEKLQEIVAEVTSVPREPLTPIVSPDVSESEEESSSLLLVPSSPRTEQLEEPEITSTSDTEEDESDGELLEAPLDLLALKRKLEEEERSKSPKITRKVDLDIVENSGSKSKENFERAQKLGKFFGMNDQDSLQDMASGLEDDPIGTMQSLDKYLERKKKMSTKHLVRQISDKDVAAKRKFTLEDRVRRKWEKPAEKLPVAIDLPRLLKHIEIKTVDGETLIAKTEKPPPGSEPQSRPLTRKSIRNFLETLAIQLGDTKDTLPLLVQHFETETEEELQSGRRSDISVFLKVFLNEHLAEDNRTLRVLKSINQSIIAPPFVHLKNQFSTIDCSFVDVSGTWKITVTIGPGDGGTQDFVTVTHSKGAKSSNTNPNQGFEFVWQLNMVFDRDMKKMKKATLSIPLIEFQEDFPKEKKTAINLIIKAYEDEAASKLERQPSGRFRSGSGGYHEPIRSGTPGERRFVDDLLGGKFNQPLYLQWGTSMVDDKTLKDRLLVISDYRIYFIRRTKMGKKKIVKEAHLFDLREIYTPDPDKITLTFINWGLDFVSQTAGDVIPTVLIPAYERITQCFPERFKLIVSVDRPSRFEKSGALTVQQKAAPGKGFIDTYKAFCDYFRQPVSKTFVVFAESLVNGGHRDLKIDECPGLELGEEYTFDLEPVAAALRYNTFFRSLRTQTTVRKDAVIRFADTMEYNQSLRKLVLSGLDAEDGFVELGNSFKMNRGNVITELDVSCNNIKDKGMRHLAEGIQTLNHLTKISVAKCNLGSSGIIHLIKAIGNNYKLSCFLTYLDISYNECGTYGSAAIGNWFSTRKKTDGQTISKSLGSTASLKKLLMASCSLDVYGVFKELIASVYCDSVQTIDISDNRPDKLGLQALSSFCDASATLQELKLSANALNPKAAFKVLYAISENKRLHDVKVDLAENNLGPIGAQTIAKSIQNSRNIVGFDLRLNNLKKDGMLTILKAASTNPNLRELNLSTNKAGRSSEVLKQLEILFSTSGLESFKIAGAALGKSLGTTFHSLSSNKKLTHLDITKNVIGNQAATQLAEALRSNASITSLKLDRNDLSVEGWKAINNSLNSNKTLIELPLPEYDIARAIAGGKDSQVSFERITAVMLSIKENLKRNRPKLTSIKGIGISEDTNPLHRESMEDEHISIDKFGGEPKQGFFGIYDGHGGTAVAEFVVENLHKVLLNELKAHKDDYKAAFTQAFLKVDQEIIDRGIRKAGTTAVTALIRVNEKGERWLYVANIGDARAVLNRNGEAVRLSYDHKASDEVEIKRVRESGCFVINGRLGGSLAVSRAFGDVEFKRAGLIAEPYFTETLLTPTDTQLIIACDGLWDVATDQDAIDLIKNETDPQRMSEDLLHFSLEQGTRDNVTIMVLTL